MSDKDFLCQADSSVKGDPVSAAPLQCGDGGDAEWQYSSEEAGLLPCPHCGPGQSIVTLWQDHASCWKVTCGACGSSSGILPEGERWPDAKERIIASWNKRHNAQSQLEEPGTGDEVSAANQSASLTPKTDHEARAREIVFPYNSCLLIGSDKIDLIGAIALALSQSYEEGRKACQKAALSVARHELEGLGKLDRETFTQGDVREAYYVGANDALLRIATATRNQDKANG